MGAESSVGTNTCGTQSLHLLITSSSMSHAFEAKVFEMRISLQIGNYVFHPWSDANSQDSSAGAQREKT